MTIKDPFDQEVLAKPSVAVHGRVDTYAENIHVSVNGKKANTNNKNFILNSLPLEPGSNKISVQVVDSFRNRDQKEIAVFYDDTVNQEWIELVPEHPAFSQPMKITMKVIPHLQNDLNQNSAKLTYDGPGAGEISLINSNEYSLRFDTPGLYSITHSVADIQGNWFFTDTILSVMEPFIEKDWQAMHEATKVLEDIYLTWVGNMDITELRQQVLEKAQTNQDFSSVALCGDALCLVYEGIIPIILDLPDPDAPPTEGSSGVSKRSAGVPSNKLFNQDHLDKLLKTKICKKCDLEGADLSGVDLSGGNIDGSHLKGADLHDRSL